MPESCVFCTLPEDRVVDENDHFIVIRDDFPVTEFHSLVISKRHIPSYFELSKQELESLNALLALQRKMLLGADAKITGFNVGVNDGVTAGQTIFHLHVHLIPRRDGDVEAPRGGVRGVIPARQSY